MGTTCLSSFSLEAELWSPLRFMGQAPHSLHTSRLDGEWTFLFQNGSMWQRCAFLPLPIPPYPYFLLSLHFALQSLKSQDRRHGQEGGLDHPDPPSLHAHRRLPCFPSLPHPLQE